MNASYCASVVDLARWWNSNVKRNGSETNTTKTIKPNYSYIVSLCTEKVALISNVPKSYWTFDLIFSELGLGGGD
jgi:hypothetical protein